MSSSSLVRSISKAERHLSSPPSLSLPPIARIRAYAGTAQYSFAGTHTHTHSAEAEAADDDE